MTVIEAIDALFQIGDRLFVLSIGIYGACIAWKNMDGLTEQERMWRAIGTAMMAIWIAAHIKH